MQVFAMLLLTAVTLAAAAYTHRRIPYHTKTTRDRRFVHTLLIAVGIAFAWVTSQQYPVTGLLAVLVFLCSFGVVHVPAAAILFIKRQQKTG